MPRGEPQDEREQRDDDATGQAALESQQPAGDRHRREPDDRGGCSDDRLREEERARVPDRDDAEGRDRAPLPQDRAPRAACGTVRGEQDARWHRRRRLGACPRGSYLGQEHAERLILRDDRGRAEVERAIADRLVQREHHDRRLRYIAAHHREHVDPVLVRHVVVEDEHVWAERAHLAQRLVAVGGDTDHAQAVLGGDGLAQSFADPCVVVGDHDTPLPRSRGARRALPGAALFADRGIDVSLLGVAELDHDLPERDLRTLTQTLLGQRALELRRRRHSRIDEVQAERRLRSDRPLHQTEESLQLDRAERLHQIRGRPNGARERAALGVVGGREQHDGCVLRRRQRAKLSADREAIAHLTGELHVEQHDVGTRSFRERYALVRCRRLQDVPALRAERDTHGRAEVRVVVDHDDAR